MSYVIEKMRMKKHRLAAPKGNEQALIAQAFNGCDLML